MNEKKSHIYVEIVSVIDAVRGRALVADSACGAVNIFIGTTRNETRGKRVLHLDFETYEPMAMASLREICERAKSEFSLARVCVQHVVGRKLAGDEVLFVGVSARHRKATLLACAFIIDELKKNVPIWKKEFFEDDAVWVTAHP